MNYLLNAPFILDFFATTGLFCLCFITVIGCKVAINALKDLFPKPTRTINKPIENDKKPAVRQKRRAPAKPVRSIEIDPEQVDRIYVKKIS